MATTTAELQAKISVKDDASKKVGATSLSFGKLTAAIGLGTLAAAAFQKATAFAVDTVKKSISAAQESEASQVKVNAILKTLTGSYKEHTQTIEEASSAALQLGFDDEDAAESMAKLLQVTGDTTLAQEAMTNAMDLARFKGIGLSEASQAITLALNGNTRVLKQLGIEIPDNASKTELLGLIMQKVGGQAEAFGNTAAGAQEKFKNSLENLQEALGQRILPIITDFYSKLAGFINSDRMQGWLKNLDILINERVRPAFAAFASFISNVLAPIFRDTIIPLWQETYNTLSPYIPVLAQIVKWLGILVGSVVLGGIIVLSATVAGLAKAFDAVVKSIKATFDWIEKVSNKAADFLKGGNVGAKIGDFLLPGRAGGGSVQAGQAYVVGEKGAEVFVPKQSGTIIPNGAGHTVNINFSGINVTNQNDLERFVAAVREATARELKLANMGV